MRTAGLVITTVLGFACLLSAQEPNRIDFGFSVAGVFSKTSSSNDGSVTDTPTTSLEYIGSVRYHLASKHAVEANVGHTINSQIFSVSSNSFRVISSITEFSGAYVFSPYARQKLQPFVFAGGGVMLRQLEFVQLIGPGYPARVKAEAVQFQAADLI